MLQRTIRPKDAAIVISDITAEKMLVGEAIKLVSDVQKKKTLSENIAKMAERDADIRIAREVLKLIKE
jgi:UDP-N-acetylglucosamine:LPS N-acetylglucosamine transferase